MNALDNDLDAQIHGHRGKAAAYRGMGDVFRKQATELHRAADDKYGEAAREDRKADRKTRRLVLLGATDARNEERARVAAAVPAETTTTEEQP